MSLFWKQFVGILGILLIFFTIFGSILLYDSFNTELEQETESVLDEITMIQYAFITAMDALPEIYRSESGAITGVMESIAQSTGNSNKNNLFVYNSEKQILYQKGSHRSSLMEQSPEESIMISRLTVQGKEHYLETLSCIRTQNGVYYLECNRNIQYLYENRDSLYDRYRIALFGMVGAAVLFSVFFSYGYTSPIHRLSLATQALANGHYDRRIKLKGNNEITQLQRDFNRMAEHLEQNIQELEDAARRQEEFTGAFAHELKTPLTSIIGYGEMLMSMEMPEEDRRTCAEYIYKEGKRLERLAYKMMELVRVDKQDIPMQSINILDLTEELRKMTGPLLTQKNIIMNIQVEPGQIWGDRDLLLSLFANLIDNARKACAENGNISFLGKMIRGGYMVQVRDNGIGMQEEELSRITEAFYMVDKSRARKEGGAGLGMALCSKIIALHNAVWEVQSKPNKGTAVGILFPRQESEMWEENDFEV